MEPSVRVDIDRIVLSDLSLPPAKAGRMRGLVREELARRLADVRDVDAWLRAATSTVTTTPLVVTEPVDDETLAGDIADRILEALRGGP